jgi:hypothetical protein
MKAATTLNYYEQLVNEEKEKFNNLLQEVKTEAEERKNEKRRKTRIYSLTAQTTRKEKKLIQLLFNFKIGCSCYNFS